MSTAPRPAPLPPPVIALLVLLAVLLAAATALLVTGPPRVAGGAAGPDSSPPVFFRPGVALGGPFTLTSQDGRRVAADDLRGSWLLLYFGFTHCPDKCPTALTHMTAALNELGPAGERIRPVFVSIDPERDTPERLAEYVTLFHPRTLGLTGTAAEVRTAAEAYRVYYRRAPTATADDPYYMVDHTTLTYLVRPDGTLQGAFSEFATGADIAATLRSVGAVAGG